MLLKWKLSLWIYDIHENLSFETRVSRRYLSRQTLSHQIYDYIFYFPKTKRDKNVIHLLDYS